MKNSIEEQLRSLKELYDSGVINRDEFMRMKTKILAESLVQQTSENKNDSAETKKANADSSIQQELNRLKQMFDSGAVSQEEFKKMKSDVLRKSMVKDGVKSAMEPSASSKFFKRNKKLFIFILIAIVFLILGFWYFQPDVKTEGAKLAKKHCDCQEQNNLEYINRLENFLSDFDAKEYKYAVGVEKDFDKLKSEFKKNTFKPEILNCYSDYDLELEKNEVEFPRNTSKGKDFWFAYQSTITQNKNLETQRFKIKSLIDRIDNKRSSLSFSNPREFQDRKGEILNKMNSFYSDISNGNVDAYDYFAYRTERYYGHKNISPTDINRYFESSKDYEAPSFNIITETIVLKSKEKGNEVWVFAIEFKAYRPSKQKYQVSNIWYEVKFNSSNKITSYFEQKVENTKFFEPESYDWRSNGNSQAYYYYNSNEFKETVQETEPKNSKIQETEILYKTTILRSPESRKDFANVFWNKEYTLFDKLTDEPIFAYKKNGLLIYKIYCTTSESLVAEYVELSPEQLQKKTAYKFLNFENCNKWIESKKRKLNKN
jgi:hypothetical protein